MFCIVKTIPDICKVIKAIAPAWWRAPVERSNAFSALSDSLTTTRALPGLFYFRWITKTPIKPIVYGATSLMLSILM